VSETLTRIQALVERGDVRISDHGYDELAADAISATETIEGIQSAIVVEEYASANKGPSVLVLQRDADGRPVHVVWGIPSNQERPAVLVTAYRPDPMRWSADFKVRKK
jgi:hypothetical protein